MTEKQSRFCTEYLVDLNATEAAKRAGYSERTAYSIGHENLRKPEIANRLAELKAERSERTGVTLDRVLEEMALIGFSNIRDYVIDGDTGAVTLAEGVSEDAMRAVSSIKQKTKTYRRGEDDVREVDVEIKLWSKDRQLENMGKHVGMFGPKGTEDDPLHHEHRHNLGWSDGPDA